MTAVLAPTPRARSPPPSCVSPLIVQGAREAHRAPSRRRTTSCDRRRSGATSRGGRSTRYGCARCVADLACRSVSGMARRSGQKGSRSRRSTETRRTRRGEHGGGRGPGWTGQRRKKRAERDSKALAMAWLRIWIAGKEGEDAASRFVAEIRAGWKAGDQLAPTVAEDPQRPRERTSTSITVHRRACERRDCRDDARLAERGATMTLA